jgi:hypothetical protein
MSYSTSNHTRRRPNPKYLRRRVFHSFRQSTLESIAAVKAFIDTVVLNVYVGPKKVQQMLGPFKMDESFDPKERGNTYRTKGVRNDENGRLFLLSNRDNENKPLCRLEIHPNEHISPIQHRELLQQISQALNEATLSRVDAGVDFYTKKSPERLLTLFERYLYAPYSTRIKEKG